MPKTKNLSIQSAVSKGAFGGGWSVGTVLDIASAVQRHQLIARETNILRIYLDTPAYILFDASADASNTTTTNSTGNDLILDAGKHDIPIPQGLYVGEKELSNRINVIYFHVLAVTNIGTAKCRIVES